MAYVPITTFALLPTGVAPLSLFDQEFQAIAAGQASGPGAQTAANTFWAGPASGAPADPAFRHIVLADLPNGMAAIAMCSTVAELQAIDTTQFTIAWFAGRGMFQWLVGDYSAQAAADTLGMVYVSANAVPSTSGIWVLQEFANTQEINLLWGGITHAADTTSAFNCALAVLALTGNQGGGTICLPGGTWLGNWVLPEGSARNITIRGASNTSSGSVVSTMLKPFDTLTPALQVIGQVANGTVAKNFTLRDFFIWQGSATLQYQVWIEQCNNVNLDRVTIWGGTKITGTAHALSNNSVFLGGGNGGAALSLTNNGGTQQNNGPFVFAAGQIAVQGGTGRAIEIVEDTISVSFVGVDIDGVDGPVSVDGGGGTGNTGNVLFDGCHSESSYNSTNNTAFCVVGQTTTFGSVKFMGGTFWGQGNGVNYLEYWLRVYSAAHVTVDSVVTSRLGSANGFNGGVIRHEPGFTGKFDYRNIQADAALTLYSDATGQVPSTAKVPNATNCVPWDAKQIYPEQFGCVGDGVTDDTTNFQAAVTWCGGLGAELVLGNGKNYLLTGNINVGVGNQSVDIRGQGWQNSKITFSGASVTTGLTLTGVNWSYAGKISNLEIHGVSGALAGITCTYLNHPVVDRCIINGFDGGYAVKFDGCLMAMFSNNLVGGAGSATLGQVIVEGVTAGSTTFMWLHSRISGDGATGAKCGLQIDNTGDTLIVGGAIESTNTPIMVSGNPSLTGGCISGTIYDIDLENPGNGNYYLSFGAGWTGAASAAASNWLIDRVGCAVSGTTQMPGAIYLNHTFGLKFNAGSIVVPVGVPAPTASFVLDGTGNVDTHIDTHPTMAGYSYPWVTINGVWQKDASPLAPYRQAALSGPALFGGQTITGATPTTIVSASQGGYHGELIPYNSTATTMTSLGSTGLRGQQVYLISLGAGVTTLQQGTGTDQFNLIGGVNLAMTSGRPYGFVHSGTYWQQMY